MQGSASGRFNGALRGAQKTLSLIADGLVNTDGPTIRKLLATPGSGRFGAQARLMRRALPLIDAAATERLQRDADTVLRHRGSATLTDYLVKIWHLGAPGMLKTIELLGRVGERDRGLAANLRRGVAPRLAAADRPLLFAGDLVRSLSRDEFAAGEHPAQKFLAGKSPTTVPVTGPAQTAPPPPPPVQLVAPIPVPAYKQDVFKDRQNANAWPDFVSAVRGTPGLSRGEQKAFTDIFAAEGGVFPDGSTVAGITQTTLNDLIARGHVIGIAQGTKPGALNMAERVRVYRGYFDFALRRAGGSKAMRLIGDSNAAAAFADALFRHGSTGGGILIQKAINSITKNRVTIDGVVGRDTIKAFADLVAVPKSRHALFVAVAAERIHAVANHPNRAGELVRIDYFRFQKSP